MSEIPKLAELLATPERWCKRFFAVDARGIEVAARGESAAKRCMRGAITYTCVAGNLPYGTVESAVADSIRELSGDNHGRISAWNDAPERTHAEVLQVARRADELIAQRLTPTASESR